MNKNGTVKLFSSSGSELMKVLLKEVYEKDILFIYLFILYFVIYFFLRRFNFPSLVSILGQEEKINRKMPEK